MQHGNSPGKGGFQFARRFQVATEVQGSAILLQFSPEGNHKKNLTAEFVVFLKNLRVLKS